MKLVYRSNRDALTLPLRISNDPSVTTTKVKKSKKKISEQKKSQSLEEPTMPEPTKTSKHSPLTRSKTYDLTTSKTLENESGLERKKSATLNLPKHNLTFHRVFKEVPEEEDLIDSFSCAWQKEVLCQGRIYISTNYIGFYCTMLRKEIKVLIRISDIAILKKANTALLVPNALSIKTWEGEKYLFGSLRNREASYHAILALCPQLQDGSPNSSPLTSPANTSLEQCKQPLNTSQSDLEQELQDSNQTFCFPDVPDGAISVHNKVKEEGEMKKSPAAAKSQGDSWESKLSPKTARKASWQNLSSINILLIIYLMLVVVLLLSSGYIGLRIVELEQQLTLMGAWPEMNLQSGYKES
ncbi:GRAM domain-containing protein 2B-like isoform X2 [Ambystoma mexicanum]|uniref:GRAM domain-containing protein 2B-like isoform X2 n=1 Tax=Ambystoma mexicanum TaxID=8296 RepID=UPI0037E812E6